MNFAEKAFDQTGVAIVSDAFRAPAASKSYNAGVQQLAPNAKGR